MSRSDCFVYWEDGFSLSSVAARLPPPSSAGHSRPQRPRPPYASRELESQSHIRTIVLWSSNSFFYRKMVMGLLKTAIPYTDA
jgi:hypothetical protein